MRRPRVVRVVLRNVRVWRPPGGQIVVEDHDTGERLHWIPKHEGRLRGAQVGERFGLTCLLMQGAQPVMLKGHPKAERVRATVKRIEEKPKP